MKFTLQIIFIGLIILVTNCTLKKEEVKDMEDTKYSSAITFLYYDDFSYGINFMENVYMTIPQTILTTPTIHLKM